MTFIGLKAYACAALALAFASTGALADPVRINGSTTVAGIIVTPMKADIEKLAGTEIAITPSNSGHGLEDVAAGRADIAMISASLADVAAKVNKSAPGSIDPSIMQTTELGHAHLLFVVGSKNPVRKLTSEQLADIFSGKITDWSAVGGPNNPIEVVAEQPSGAMRTELEKELLKGEAITKDATLIKSAPNAASYIDGTSAAIGFISSATPIEYRDKVVSIQTDSKIEQTLILVTKGKPTDASARVIEAIRDVSLKLLAAK